MGAEAGTQDPRVAGLLRGLDPEQTQAVLAPPGPVLVLAGAGTGKTRTLTSRIAYLVATGQVQAASVLAVTHSARAAAELRSRLEQLGVYSVQARTFHAAALRQLSYFWPATGLPGTAPVLVSSLPGGRYGLLRQALSATLSVHPSKVDSTDVLDLDGEVTWAMAQQVGPAQYPAAAAKAARSRSRTPQVIASAFELYERFKREAGVVDFDDLIAQCALLLETDADVAARVRAQYQLFVVDEFQDTDPAQNRLLRAWLGARDNVTVVGDPYQSIYRFKGAEPALISSFAQEFPGTFCVGLVRDYRSGPAVVAAANALMRTAARPGQAAGLVLEGHGPHGPGLRVSNHPTEDDEDCAVASKVRQLIASGTPAQQIAVLHRFNSQAPRLEAALREAGIPVTFGGGETFFDRAEVLRALRAFAARTETDPGQPALPVLTAALRSTGFDPDAPPEGAGAARERWESQAALADLARGMAPDVLDSAGALLAELRRLASLDHVPSRTGAVTISTIHKAKGLEWDVVFVPRMTEGSLPSTFATTPDDLEEERRLLYVAITRARLQIELSYALRREEKKPLSEPSRFLAWLSGASATAPTGSRASARRAQQAGPSRPGPVARVKVGQRVTHDTHGLGRVTKIDGGKVVVDFGASGVRTLSVKDRKLSPL